MTRSILISTAICFFLSSCSLSQVGDWSGQYIGNNVKLILDADSCCTLEIRADLSGYWGGGKWMDDGKLIVLDFPVDSLNYKTTDITRFLTRSLNMESIIIEKHRKGRLFWRNRGYLIKKK